MPFNWFSSKAHKLGKYLFCSFTVQSTLQKRGPVVSRKLWDSNAISDTSFCSQENIKLSISVSLALPSNIKGVSLGIVKPPSGTLTIGIILPAGIQVQPRW